MDLLQLQMMKWEINLPQLKRLEETLMRYMQLSPKPQLVVILGDCSRGGDDDSKNII